MAERSYPFTKAPGSTTEPGTTSDAEFSAFFSLLVPTGVAGSSIDGQLKAYGNSSGMSVFIPAGAAIIRGHFYSNPALLTKAIAAGGAQPRIDSVVLRLEYAGVNDAHVVVLQGTPGASPVAPALTQTVTGVYEMLLANVSVPANAVTVSASGVTDKRIFTAEVGRPIAGKRDWVTSSNSGQLISQAPVVFPPGSFQVTPIITVSVNTGIGGSGKFVPRILAPTKDGFNVAVYHGDGTALPLSLAASVNWIATPATTVTG